ncbi:hypothetical protein AURDEDRAFT_175738 [Auricularia subglabra TFB-10046 SS5]|uniref:Uncharacterized protein n=1 Tax=Auricularia subglabra (strain TFB-10046 / SS5) TaxID=717982 RepID=J0D7X2_AURST|nr:hypothetical protein AURDEDRAFT_175738 [Auricularia subglabra TFB-10046 SS5]
MVRQQEQVRGEDVRANTSNLAVYRSPAYPLAHCWRQRQRLRLVWRSVASCKARDRDSVEQRIVAGRKRDCAEQAAAVTEQAHVRVVRLAHADPALDAPFARTLEQHVAACARPLADGRKTERLLRIENAKLRAGLQEIRAVVHPLFTGAHSEEAGYYAFQAEPAPARDAYLMSAAPAMVPNMEYPPGAHAAYHLGVQADAPPIANGDAVQRSCFATGETVATVGSAAEDAGVWVNVFGPSVPPFFAGAQEGNM